MRTHADSRGLMRTHADSCGLFRHIVSKYVGFAIAEGLFYEFEFVCFVVNDEHGHIHAQTAAKCGKQKQKLFPVPPIANRCAAFLPRTVTITDSREISEK